MSAQVTDQLRVEYPAYPPLPTREIYLTLWLAEDEPPRSRTVLAMSDQPLLKRGYEPLLSGGTRLPKHDRETPESTGSSRSRFRRYGRTHSLPATELVDSPQDSVVSTSRFGAADVGRPARTPRRLPGHRRSGATHRTRELKRVSVTTATEMLFRLAFSGCSPWV